MAAIKVHWFRMSALSSRWWEEDGTVIEEMRRSVRYFKCEEDMWLRKGEEAEERGEDGAAAYARK